MADWSLPTIVTSYTEVLAKLAQKDVDSATMFSEGSSSNVPDGTIRWNIGLAKFQKLNGDTYEDLASTYNINVDKIRGVYPRTATVVDTLALRDAAGDINTRLFRSEYASQTAAPTSTASVCFRNSTTDNYMRFVTREGFISYLGRVSDSDSLAGIGASRYQYVNRIYNPSAGVLITTNVQYGQMVRIEINGNGYASGDVLNTVIEFYVYKNASDVISIENPQAIQSGKPFDVHIFMQGGVAKVWIPKIGDYVTYNIFCSAARTTQNLPITLTDESDPTDGITTEKRITPKLISTGVELTGKVQAQAYRRSVVAFADLTNTNVSLESFSSGRLALHRSNGNQHPILLDIYIQKIYNQTNANGVLFEYAGHYAKLCTFTYNGTKYAGIEFFYTDSNMNRVFFEGNTTFNIFGVDYWDTQNNVAINTEIADSLSYDVVDNTDIYAGGKKIDGGLGIAQTWQDVTSDRANDVVYTNDTDKPIEVLIGFHLESQQYCYVYLDDIQATVGYESNNGSGSSVSFIVPPGSTYKLSDSGTIYTWMELR